MTKKRLHLFIQSVPVFQVLDLIEFMVWLKEICINQYNHTNNYKNHIYLRVSKIIDA